MSIASFVCAIVGIAFCAVPLGLAAIILGLAAKKKNGFAIAGITIGCIDLVIG